MIKILWKIYDKNSIQSSFLSEHSSISFTKISNFFFVTLSTNIPFPTQKTQCSKKLWRQSRVLFSIGKDDLEKIFCHLFKSSREKVVETQNSHETHESRSAVIYRDGY